MTPPMSSRFEPPISRTNSPIPARPGSCASGSYSPRVGEGFRSSPKPHSSPKMKLRFWFYNTPSCTISFFIAYNFYLIFELIIQCTTFFFFPFCVFLLFLYISIFGSILFFLSLISVSVIALHVLFSVYLSAPHIALSPIQYYYDSFLIYILIEKMP